MKTLFEFHVSREEEVEVPEVTKDAEGKEITILRKEKKLVPQKFLIRRPTREMVDEADFYEAKQFNRAVNAGLMTRAQLYKRFDNDGGTLSEDEKAELSNAYFSLLEKIEKHKLLASEPKEKQDKEQIDKLDKEMINLRQLIQQYELRQSSPYNYTAEVRARNKTIMWWVMFLAYKLNEKGEPIPLFGEGNEEKKNQVWSDLEDGDDNFIKNVISRFVYFVSFWHVGRAKSKEQFEELDKEINKETEPS